ncbi:uncharacterized protein PV07_09109 [Cladophialophora immunda]|uniref:Biotrophy-associated secreted protein 2 n=1 Tax=Cladophialophora immunda TaxID=569365 RepID=A0A0D1ZE48_9EURO|nr:uncharacterized protein PV07_09109 [Cladophialophora immunda]KIW25976.1 hypothetical protein PV07_09109 [Cladophialophora immunda]OQU98080.1 hypothetical protein CLAIMM_03911 [Cladophialophora immunda]
MITNTPSKSSSMMFLLLNLALLVLGQGTQFITGPCTSDADCASSCCGFNSGLCAGPVIAQTRDGGCGFGDPQPNDIAAQAFFSSQSAAAAGATSPATAAPAPAPASTTAAAAAASSGSNNGNVGTGTQFITGPCTSDADCASGCCGFNTGLCAGAIVAQERDGGCGFGDAQPNDNAAQLLRGQQPTSAATSAPAPANTASTSSGTSSSGSGTSGSNPPIDSTIPGSQNVGKANGSQFITGQCFSDADCASGCCGFNTGKCAGAIIAQTRDGGCGFGDAQPNDTAAKALEGGAKKRRGIGAVREYMA